MTVFKNNTASTSWNLGAHRMPQTRVIVQHGCIQEGMEQHFAAANPDELELTSQERLKAIATKRREEITENRERVQRRAAEFKPTDEVETVVLAAEVTEPEICVPIEALTAQDAELTVDEKEFEEALDVPWKEAA